MLQKTQAMRALQDGCRRLGLPSRTATALVQFLSVKRTHDQFVAAESRQLLMSPGYSLDRLWHYMLLNTAVSSLVHDLLGGVVEHRGIDSTDLPDDTKLLQRLYALNILRLEGHQPDVTLWTEPGTALHTLHLTASPVAALQRLPGVGRLYVTPTLTQQQQGQLVQALRLLYAEGNVTSDSGMQLMQPMPQTAVCAASGAHVAQQQAAKRARNEQSAAAIVAATTAALEPQGPSDPWVHIFLRDQMGQEVPFKIRPWDRLEEIMSPYADEKSLDRGMLRFMFRGMRVFTDHTPQSLGMERVEFIEVLMSQAGC